MNVGLNNAPSCNLKNGNAIFKDSEMEDLIHLTGPLTEDAVMKTLQARFLEKKFFVSKILQFLLLKILNNFKF